MKHIKRSAALVLVVVTSSVAQYALAAFIQNPTVLVTAGVIVGAALVAASAEAASRWPS
jgi:flagellar motor component MotA